MDKKLYTMQLTANELFIIRFELDLVAQQHDQKAERIAEMAASGFGSFDAQMYWREQAACCRCVVEKAEAALDAGPSPEV